MALRKSFAVAELREVALKASADHAQKEKPPRTKADAIRAVREEIAQLRHQGFTWEEVADVFKDTLDASAATIRLAIGTKTRTRAPSVDKKGHAEKSKRALPAAAIVSKADSKRVSRSASIGKPSEELSTQQSAQPRKFGVRDEDL